MKYFAYKVDIGKIEAIEILDKYKVSQFPTTLFLDYKGNVLGRLKGFYPPEYFIKMLEMNQNRQGNMAGKEENFDAMITNL